MDNINLLQAIRFLHRGWTDVHPNVILNSFRKAGFTDGPESPVPPFDECPLVKRFQEYAAIDQELFAEEVENILFEEDSDEDGWKQQLVSSTSCSADVVGTDDGHRAIPANEPLRVSLDDALSALESLKLYILNNADMSVGSIDALFTLSKDLTRQCRKRELAKKQSCIYDFWK